MTEYGIGIKRRAVAVAIAAVVMFACLVPVVADTTDADAGADDATYGSGIYISVGDYYFGLSMDGVIGFIPKVQYGSVSDTSGGGGGDQEDVYEQLRGLYSDGLINVWNAVRSVISSLLPADTTLWGFTSNYWNRATELAVADAWAYGLTYDANTMTENALLRQSVENYIYVWTATVDQAFNPMIGKHTDFVSTNECWGNIVMSFVWDTESIDLDADEDAYIDLLQAVTDTSVGDLIYISTQDNNTDESYDATTSGTMYVFGSSTVTIRDIYGTTYTLYEGANDVSQMTSGLYRIETAGATLCGPMSEAAGESTYFSSSSVADVAGAMVLVAGGEMYYVLADGDGVTVYDSTGTGESSTTLGIQLAYTGSDGDTTQTAWICSEDGTYNIVRDWNAMIEQIDYVIGQAAVAGETIWGIFDVTQKSSVYISPSSVTATLASLGLGLSAAESTALYIQALMQIASYYETYGDSLEGMELSINSDAISTGLYCHGSIYYNGQLWADDIVFTPYQTGSTMTFAVGENTVSSTGFAMVWAQGVSIDEWDGSLSSYALLNIGEGYIVVIDEILYEGAYCDEVTLSQTVIETYTTGGDEGSDVVEPVKVIEVSGLVMVIILELAAIVFLLFWKFGSPIWGAILALIIVLVAVFLSGTIADMLVRT